LTSAKAHCEEKIMRKMNIAFTQTKTITAYMNRYFNIQVSSTNIDIDI